MLCLSATGALSPLTRYNDKGYEARITTFISFKKMYIILFSRLLHYPSLDESFPHLIHSHFQLSHCSTVVDQDISPVVGNGDDQHVACRERENSASPTFQYAAYLKLPGRLFFVEPQRGLGHF